MMEKIIPFMLLVATCCLVIAMQVIQEYNDKRKFKNFRDENNF